MSESLQLATCVQGDQVQGESPLHGMFSATKALVNQVYDSTLKSPSGSAATE